jgi:hypothetical protein
MKQPTIFVRNESKNNVFGKELDTRESEILTIVPTIEKVATCINTKTQEIILYHLGFRGGLFLIEKRLSVALTNHDDLKLSANK